MLRAKTGFALIWSLLMVTFLFLLAGALLSNTFQQVFLASNSRDRQQALLAAESGLVDAQIQLQNNPDWQIGFDRKPLPSGAGAYTIQFADDQSRNNLTGSVPIASFRGEDSVPPHCVLLLVTGETRGVTRQLEVLLSPRALDLGPSALASTGRIFLDGSVSVSGVQSMANATAVEAGLHSNSLGSDTKVRWRPGADSQARADISGMVSSCGDDGSIDAPGEFHALGNETLAAQRTIRRIDILGQISAHSGATDPTSLLQPDLTVLPQGDFYYDGNLTLNGDLELHDGARIFVSGSLEVNGAIRGSGTVAVAGNTTFKGDALLGQSSELVSVLSQGNIHLNGFDADQYMASLADQSATHFNGDPTTVGQMWGEVKQSVSGMANLMQQRPNNQYAGQSSPFNPAQPAHEYDWNDYARSMSNSTYQAANPLSGAGLHSRVAPQLIDILAQRNDSAARFLTQRLTTLAAVSQECIKDMTGQSLARTVQDYESVVDAYLQGSSNPDSVLGVADILTTDFAWPAAQTPAYDKFTRAYNLMTNQLLALSFDRLGNSSFQGLLYTHGSVSAENDVTVTGMLIARGEGGEDVQAGSDVLHPGDIKLSNGSRFLYVEDLFSDPESSPMFSLGLGSLRWLSR